MDRRLLFHPLTWQKALDRDFHEGLIVCSACLDKKKKVKCPAWYKAGDIEEAEKQVKWFQRHIRGRLLYKSSAIKLIYPVQTQRKVFERQQEVNPELTRIARRDIKIGIATNDVHFVNEDDADAHWPPDMRSTNKAVDDLCACVIPKQEWLKSQSEMNDIFSDIPEAIGNTMEILESSDYIFHWP